MLVKNLTLVKKSGILYLSAFFMLIQNLQAQKPKELSDFIAPIKVDTIGQAKPFIKYRRVSDKIIHITVNWVIRESVQQNDVQIVLQPIFKPTYYWAPHLTPTDSSIIAQHVFRCPALITQTSKKQVCIVPDLDLLNSFQNGQNNMPQWYMDMDAVHNKFVLGLSLSQIREHVLYYKRQGAIYLPGKYSLGFYIFMSEDKSEIFNPWKSVLSFMWQKWGKPLYKKGEPLYVKDMQKEAKQTYKWAFENWKTNVWQDIVINKKDMGAPVFIVNVTQSPDWNGIVNERETRSVWNQAWFNSFRSAMGLFRYAKSSNNDTLLKYAIKTKDLSLSFPKVNGFFYSVIATDMDTFHSNGNVYNKSKGWNAYYWGNSNRNPFTWEIKKSPFHILDMSYTAYWMLCWYDELEKDARLLQYAKRYADTLIRIQEPDGFFPAWISLDEQKPMGYLDNSPETSMSVSFLLKLYDITKDFTYRSAALKALGVVQKNIVMQDKWEDFETYWSCSRYGSDSLVGKKIARNKMFKQNTLGMYYTAQAFYDAYSLTKKSEYLKYGERVLDLMLMYQATWQPKYMYVNVLGGFGVMNGDAEWNDSRQSLFAELIIDYGKVLNNEMYIQRGIAALKASFVMMYSPNNSKTKKQWESRWPFFGPRDYGFMMENYGHDGVTANNGKGMGEFTIYDWGNGAASEAYYRIESHFNKKWLNRNLY